MWRDCAGATGALGSRGSGGGLARVSTVGGGTQGS